MLMCVTVFLFHFHCCDSVLNLLNQKLSILQSKMAIACIIFCSFKKKYLFTYFLTVLDLHYYVWAFSSWGEPGSCCGGFSCCGARALECMGSVVVVRRSQGMWNLPGPGIEPVSSALAGGSLTTGPLGRSTATF